MAPLDDEGGGPEVAGGAAEEEDVWAATAESEEGESVVLEQDFAQLEQAFEEGTWEVQGIHCGVDGGDDPSLYTCDGSAPGEGPPGAVIVTEGRCDAWAELVHPLRGGEGAQVSRLSASLLCESLDAGSAGSFAIGLAYNEDIEESSLLSLTLRRERESPGDEEGFDPASKPIELHLNGARLVEDIGKLPVKLDFEAKLKWSSAPPHSRRKVYIRCRVREVDLAEATAPGDGAGAGEDAAAAEMPIRGSADFYTRGETLSAAQTLFMRCTGAVKVRPMRLRCCSAQLRL